jgi:transposase
VPGGEPDLPAARLDGPAREVKLLSNYRRNLVTERTILVNRLRWDLHELDPGLQVPSCGLHRYCVLNDLAAQLAAFDGVAGRIAAELIAGCQKLTAEVNALGAELRALVRALAPALLAVPGCGVPGAPAIVGETAAARRSGQRTPSPGSPAARRSRSGTAAPLGRSASTAAVTCG